ncbi:uncharacterized protein [Cherax quadricarinatus]|uniref:uncharacterized protein n=1 Tax=Cherax quadricarinatus TaxID=27406 RepID=UPI00387E6C04
MIFRLVAFLLVATCTRLVLSVPLEDEVKEARTDVPLARTTNTVGNVLYSVVGFFLGGLLLFVSLFDPTRKPVIRFFDTAFGDRELRRQRRQGEGSLEQHVAAAFDTFTSALDKMQVIAKIVN